MTTGKMDRKKAYLAIVLPRTVTPADCRTVAAFNSFFTPGDVYARAEEGKVVIYLKQLDFRRLEEFTAARPISWRRSTDP